MKFQTPLDSHIQSCIIGPFYPVGKHWNKYSPCDDFPSEEDNLPYFGKITTSPNSDNKIYCVPATHPTVNKLVWFPELDGAYKFELEVPRYSKEDISVEIQDDGAKTLVIVAERRVGNNTNYCFTEKYAIPSSLSLDLEHSSVRVENGLLTIFFPAKKVENKTIKLL